MGVVYRARDMRLGREVALKLLAFFSPGDAVARARFEREAQALAALNHPRPAQPRCSTSAARDSLPIAWRRQNAPQRSCSLKIAP
jgi:serine/threonine protein kinase